MANAAETCRHGEEMGDMKVSFKRAAAGLAALWIALRRRPELLPDPPKKPAEGQLEIQTDPEIMVSERNDPNE